jgi:hypothetical protein
MKEINEGRFKKVEDIGFNPQPIVEMPARKEEFHPKPVIVNERTNERSDKPQKTESVSNTAYIINIPKERRKTRQSFDIFEDQYDALKKIQLAEAEALHNKTPKKLGDMTQEALDEYIKEKARKLGNITIVKD